MEPLDALFRPRSLAIVGASADANKVGGRPLAFLRKAGWRGRLFPVHPAAAEVQGIPAFASVAAIGEPIDQAILALPAAQVPQAARQCLAAGARALQVFSAGFGEGAGEAQAALAALAHEHGARLLGPNSLGLFNTADGFFGTFATALDGAWPSQGPVGVATQSGAFGSYFFGMAQARGLGFSHFVATGNEADVDVADCVRFLARDAATRIIVIALEGCRDGRKLAAALLAAREAGKPVLAMKVGKSVLGAQAAATHTGALAGEDRVFDAVLRSCGAWRAASLQALVDAACLAGVGPLPAGRELLVVTTSGGIGVLCADAAEACGLALPAISGAAQAAVRGIAPLAAGSNPVDTSAGILADLAAYARIAAVALADRRFGAVLCFLAHIPRNAAHWAQLREPLYTLRRQYAHLPFVAVALADSERVAELQAQAIAVFSDPGAAVAAVAALAGREVSEVPATEVEADALPPTGLLAGEQDARAALAGAGIHFAPERFVRDADQATAAARELGYPVVLKIVSPDIGHKTEAGGVQLGIANEAQLREALPSMQRRVAAARPQARLRGFAVARELRGGIEVLVGTRDDPVFGPIVTVGAGGVLAELLDDVCVRLAPVSETTALAMLRATRVGRLLQGFRGAPPCDLAALARQVALLSRVAWALRGRVAAIELNPVLALPDGAFALDALVQARGD